jgi:hypothetical protein
MYCIVNKRDLVEILPASDSRQYGYVYRCEAMPGRHDFVNYHPDAAPDSPIMNPPKLSQKPSGR